MASRPTSDLFNWASSGTIVEPSSGQKAAGWEAGQRPPAQWFNFLFRNLGDWLAFLDDGKLQDVARPEADISMIGTDNTAADHPGSPGNIWKQLWHGALTDGAYVRFLVGVGANGAWAITKNAAWNPGSGAQNWSQDNAALSSTILWSDANVLKYEAKAAGSSAWTTWDQEAAIQVDDLLVNDDCQVTGDLDVTGASLLADTTVDGNMSVTGQVLTALDVVGSIDSGGDIAASDDLVAGDQVQYGSVKSRTVTINVSNGAGGGQPVSQGEILQLSAGQSRVYAIAAPHGVALQNVYVKLEGVGVDYTVSLKRKSAIAMPIGGAPSYGTVATTSGTLSTLTNLSLSFGGMAASSAEEYTLYVSDQSGGAMDILAIQLTYDETVLTTHGPR